MVQRMVYAGGEFLVADVIADALLDYALQLAKRAFVDVVDVRTRREDGTFGRLRLLLGDGIALASESAWDAVPDPQGDPDDAASAALIRRRVAALGRSPVIRLDGDGHVDLMSAYDDL
ncbi:hypothetical protein [Agromyces sp. ZXT2-6]|uniref:hypothetical protein n=1 Tax=Agromyces sp. ZXT2-6 TaxID=3461153 RepID=UPI004054D9CF